MLLCPEQTSSTCLSLLRWLLSVNKYKLTRIPALVSCGVWYRVKLDCIKGDCLALAEVWALLSAFPLFNHLQKLTEMKPFSDQTATMFRTGRQSHLLNSRCPSSRLWNSSRRYDIKAGNRDDEQKRSGGETFVKLSETQTKTLTYVLVITPTQAQRAFHDFIFQACLSGWKTRRNPTRAQSIPQLLYVAGVFVG